VLGTALEASGDLGEAIKEYQKAYQIEKAGDLTAQHLGMVYLTHAYALQGDRQKALQLLDQVQEVERRGGEASVIAYGNAIIQVALGDKNRAIEWLERSYQAREAGIIEYIKVDPLLDSLRGEPRFEKLANQIVPSDRH
jgi:tetratricopeptide (TPR) repeat protein